VYLLAKVPDNLAVQTIAGATTLVNVNNVAGTFSLLTPTDSDPNNDTSGVWFVQPSVPPAAGLTLNSLPSGWRYEGWAWHDGTWLSTGVFTDPEEPDAANPYSAGENDPLAFPGEDFLTNHANLPWVFTGNDSVMITVEPNPDTDSLAAFGFRLMSRELPDDPAVGVVHGLLFDDEAQYIPGGNVVFMRSDDL
jgi:hypothetical protein